MGQVKCYDTLTKRYVTVEVTDELEQYIKRSYWREDMQDRRFQARKVLLNEEINYSKDFTDSITEELIRNYEIAYIKDRVNDLDERSRRIVQYVFYDSLNYSETARRIGVSSSYMTKLIQKILCKARQQMERDMLF